MLSDTVLQCPQWQNEWVIADGRKKHITLCLLRKLECNCEGSWHKQVQISAVRYYRSQHLSEVLPPHCVSQFSPNTSLTRERTNRTAFTISEPKREEGLRWMGHYSSFRCGTKNLKYANTGMFSVINNADRCWGDRLKQCRPTVGSDFLSLRTKKMTCLNVISVSPAKDFCVSSLISPQK